MCYRPGFWGEQCDAECQGGSESPCNHHGECSVSTGTCQCHRNWRGDSDCKQCGAGWQGQDCSVVNVGVPTTHRKCVALTNGYYMTLGGSGVTAKETGMFLFYKTSDSSVRIEVLQAPCGGLSMCVLAVALKVNNQVLLMKMKGETLETYLNDKLKNVQLGFDVSSSYQLTRPDNIQHIVSGPNGFQLTISKYELYLNLDLKTTVCAGVTGVCGDCTALSTTHSKQTTTQMFLNQMIDSSSSLMGSTVFTNKAGYALYLNGNNSGCLSKPVASSLYETNDGWITIELTLKIIRAEGVLMSFAQKHIFAIILNNGYLGFQYNDKVEMTDFTVDTGTWIRLSILYGLRTGNVMLHHINDKGTPKYKVVSTFANVFEKEGTIALGWWQLAATHADSVESKPSISAQFQGYIDRLIIWKFRYSPDDILRHSPYYILKTEPNLGVMWNYDEGFGEYAYDKVHSIPMKLVPNVWVRSNAPITQGNVALDVSPESATFFQNNTLQKKVEEKCSSLLKTGSLESTCGTSGFAPAYDFFYLHCVSSVGESGSLDKVMDSVAAMSKMCQDRTGAPSVVPSLCNEFPNRNYANTFGSNCDKRCLYGSRQNVLDKSSNTMQYECVCDDGYWGEECDKTCLRDDNNIICSGHGVCDSTNGGCICENNWKGGNNNLCDKCSDNMHGPDCKVVKLESSHDPSKVKCTLSQGVIYSLQDISVTLVKPTKYVVFQGAFLTVMVCTRFGYFVENVCLLNSTLH